MPSRTTLVLLTMLLAGPAPLAAGKLTLAGPHQQGGLLVGRTEPGAIVTLSGKRLRVSADGVFLVGFGRDAEPAQELRVSYPDGSTELRTLAIAPREYLIHRIDGIPPRQVTPTAEDLARIRQDVALVKRARARDDPRTDFLAGFVWPVTGPITGVYGSQRVLNGEPRRPHYGIDIAAPEGTPVVAPAAGVVTLVHPDMYFSGGTLIVDHGHGLSSSFLHLSKVTVQQGERVQQGQKIAEVGATGRSTGPHLDWRMNLLSTRIDASLVLEALPAPDTVGP